MYKNILLSLVIILTSCNYKVNSLEEIKPLEEIKGDITPISSITDCKRKTLYGHVEQIELREPLVSIGNNQKLAASAALAFKEMQRAALKDGITLTPISGYRDKETQRYLFYEVAKQRGQTLEQRAKVSAPPGYSEHATGLAIDLNELDNTFENTEAFKWLTKNAHLFGFEMSFDGSGKVSRESWHWRWIGNNLAKKAFCYR